MNCLRFTYHVYEVKFNVSMHKKYTWSNDVFSYNKKNDTSFIWMKLESKNS